jgi:hypothetical protein
VVHVASLRRSRGSEAKNGRFDGVGCGAESRIKLPFINCNFVFNPHFFVTPIYRTQEVGELIVTSLYLTFCFLSRVSELNLKIKFMFLIIK